MPQISISLPNSVFPLVSHLLSATVGEPADEDAPAPQPNQLPTTPRRPHSRQHRRQYGPPPAAAPPRRIPTARHRLRSSRRSASRVAHERDYERDHVDTAQHSSDAALLSDGPPPHISLLNGESSMSFPDRSEVENASYASPPPLSTDNDDAYGAFSPPPDSTYEEEDGGEEEDSDSEQYRVVETDHDGDQESVRRLRRRRRVSRNDSAGGGDEPLPVPVPSAPGASVASPAAAAGAGTAAAGVDAAGQPPTLAQVAEEAEREDANNVASARGFIGTGWWFLALLLLVQLYQSGGFIFLCLVLMYIGFNSSAMFSYRSKSWRFRLAILIGTSVILFGTILFIYWRFWDESLWSYLMFIPTKLSFNFSEALWTVWINEFVVVFLTIAAKHHLVIACASFRLLGQSTKKKLLALMEQASKLYRCSLPIPVWVLYLYGAFGEETDSIKVRGLAVSGVYVYFVALNLKCLAKELASIMGHKTPEELCRRATAEDIQKYTEDCAICREDLGLHHPLTLPCSHVFCTDCIYQWFEKHPSCPTCRAKIGSEDIFEESSGNTNIHLQENGIGLSISFDDF